MPPLRRRQVGHTKRRPSGQKRRCGWLCACGCVGGWAGLAAGPHWCAAGQEKRSDSELPQQCLSVQASRGTWLRNTTIRARVASHSNGRKGCACGNSLSSSSRRGTGGPSRVPERSNIHFLAFSTQQRFFDGPVCLVAIESAADRLPLLERRAIEKWHDTKCPLESWEGHGGHHSSSARHCQPANTLPT